jgi:hypothetical protein
MSLNVQGRYLNTRNVLVLVDATAGPSHQTEVLIAGERRRVYMHSSIYISQPGISVDWEVTA